MEQLIILLLFLGLMYFVLIRPQQKQQKQRKQMLQRLQVGDDVVTVGGLHGNVVSMDDAENNATVDLLVTAVGDGPSGDVILRFRRSAIAEVAGLDDEGADEGSAEDESAETT